MAPGLKPVSAGADRNPRRVGNSWPMPGASPPARRTNTMASVPAFQAGNASSILACGSAGSRGFDSRPAHAWTGTSMAEARIYNEHLTAGSTRTWQEMPGLDKGRLSERPRGRDEAQTPGTRAASMTGDVPGSYPGERGSSPWRRTDRLRTWLQNRG